MSDEFQQLQRAAKELIEADRLLAGDGLAPGTPLSGPESVAAPSEPRPVEKPAVSAEAKRKAAELEAIDVNEVRNCTKCGLCKGRNKTVFGEGNPDADLFFIGEGPGAEEDKHGRPFIGRAGELLTKMIVAMGLSRQDVFIGNIVKCRPPGNRAPMADEVEACLDYLIRQLRIIQPRVIVTLGNPATHTMLDTTVGITRLRGQWQSLPMLDADLTGIKVMPTFHPAFLLRQYTRDNRQKVWSDLQEVMQKLS